MDGLGGTAFGAGLTLPLLLPVSMLGLLALGLFAAIQGGAEAGRVPLAALAAAALAVLLHMAGFHLPYTGIILQGSLLVLGGLVAAARPLPGIVAVVMAVVIGAAHGLHLGAQAGSSTPLHWLGLTLGAVLLMAAGTGLNALLGEAGGRLAVRLAGAAIAGVGAALLLRVI